MHNKGVDRDEGGDDVHVCNNDENQYQDQDQVKDAMHNKGVYRDEQQDGDQQQH